MGLSKDPLHRTGSFYVIEEKGWIRGSLFVDETEVEGFGLRGFLGNVYRGFTVIRVTCTRRIFVTSV